MFLSVFDMERTYTQKYNFPVKCSHCVFGKNNTQNYRLKCDIKWPPPQDNFVIVKLSSFFETSSENAGENILT